MQVLSFVRCKGLTLHELDCCQLLMYDYSHFSRVRIISNVCDNNNGRVNHIEGIHPTTILLQDALDVDIYDNTFVGRQDIIQCNCRDISLGSNSYQEKGYVFRARNRSTGRLCPS